MIKNLHPCILEEGTKMDQEKEQHVIAYYARTQTSLSKWWNNKKLLWPSIIVFNEHQRNCEKGKLLSVIATEYSWIAPFFYDNASKYNLDVNPVSCPYFIMDFHYIFYTKLGNHKRQNVRYLLVASSLRTLYAELLMTSEDIKSMDIVRSALGS